MAPGLRGSTPPPIGHGSKYESIWDIISPYQPLCRKPLSHQELDGG